MILHVTTHKDWDHARSAGKYTAPSLQNEGFIHCSTVEQVIETANVFFKGQNGLALLCVDENTLISELKVEDPTGGGERDPAVGELFPHVYGPINLDAIIEAVDFPSNQDGLFTLPEEVTAISNNLKGAVYVSTRSAL